MSLFRPFLFIWRGRLCTLAISLVTSFFDSYLALSCALRMYFFFDCFFFTQGRESSQDEIGASAILAKEMDDKLDDAAVQVCGYRNRCASFFFFFRGACVTAGAMFFVFVRVQPMLGGNVVSFGQHVGTAARSPLTICLPRLSDACGESSDLRVGCTAQAQEQTRKSGPKRCEEFASSSARYARTYMTK